MRQNDVQEWMREEESQRIPGVLAGEWAYLMRHTTAGRDAGHGIGPRGDHPCWAVTAIARRRWLARLRVRPLQASALARCVVAARLSRFGAKVRKSRKGRHHTRQAQSAPGACRLILDTGRRGGRHRRGTGRGAGEGCQVGTCSRRGGPPITNVCADLGA